MLRMAKITIAAKYDRSADIEKFILMLMARKTKIFLDEGSGCCG